MNIVAVFPRWTFHSPQKKRGHVRLRPINLAKSIAPNDFDPWKPLNPRNRCRYQRGGHRVVYCAQCRNACQTSWLVSKSVCVVRLSIRIILQLPYATDSYRSVHYLPVIPQWNLNVMGFHDCQSRDSKKLIRLSAELILGLIPFGGYSVILDAGFGNCKL